MITAPGYGIVAEFDGTTLTVEGNNKAARMALAGKDHGEGPVTISVDQIGEVTWKAAGRLTNGNLTIIETAGKRYQLHFLRKHTEGMEALAQALGVTST